MDNEIKDFFDLIKRKKQTIMSVVLVFLVVAMIISFAQPLKYSSDSRLLVVQNFPEETDPYAISKANEYLTSVLSKVVSSNLFYEDIMDSGFLINRTYFSKNDNAKKEMKKWRKTVYAKPLSDSGIIDIKVYHQDKSQLKQIANAINFILKSKHNLYHGAGNNITIKIIDRPIISTWPTKPNVLLNVFIALVFALILSLSYIYLFPDKKYDIRLWPKKKKKNNLSNEFELTETKFKNNWQSIGDLIKEKESLKTLNDYEKIGKDGSLKTLNNYGKTEKDQIKNTQDDYENIETINKNDEDEELKAKSSLNDVQTESSEKTDYYKNIDKNNLNNVKSIKDSEIENEEMDVPDFNNKISEAEEDDDMEVISKKGDMRNLL
jgi:capsular polysaccharide biosynthesis protein